MPRESLDVSMSVLFPDSRFLWMMERSPGNFSHAEFLLLGFPGIVNFRALLLIPFCLIYAVILTGNVLLIFRIWVEKTLHSPMYSLICLLFFVNLSCTSSFMPKFLLGLAFDLNRVTLSGCLLQMYVVYGTLTFESSVVLLMAIDRYLAICRPLRYHNIMTRHLLVQLTLLCLARSVGIVLPSVVLAAKVRFCGSNVIQNFACENMSLLRLVCDDISRVHTVGFVLRTFVTMGDVSLLVISYVFILRTAMCVIGKARKKALNTCGTHLMACTVIYSSGVLSGLIYRVETSVSVDVQNLTSAIYFLLPASVNPSIYGLRIKEIRVSLMKAYGRSSRGSRENHRGEINAFQVPKATERRRDLP
ncbi:olfactory receptor 52K2-like [Spea bombifrons]|uniref:olfactory receptor 52K2-like n=1 Tax=Spea bombifrons TaxID=233779 RepID=UPI00234A8FCD|nr:olfactory receptor 52K2-like [Spea bombifrons]